MIVAPDGFIIEANGPFVGANNDASITQFMLNIEADLFKLLIPGDFILVDRGFRDVVDPLKSKGYNVLMPHYLKQASQYTTEQANESRLVTKFRWTVEAKNGHLKTKYKIFNNCISVKLLPLIPDLFRIACALENVFAKPLIFESNYNTMEIERMRESFDKENSLLKKLTNDQILETRSARIWGKVDHKSLPEFPRLDYDDLRSLTHGSYQIKILDHMLLSNKALMVPLN
ncbi:uncharacterized protein B4U79_02748 [Dinothrombium tinctorium]|uniref:DDE Tnp4 domain-containing protein n=1 Tax=Dinothrombium tinctorium TaxID=1965070 RepID=A0A3S3P1L9_9ACAR|nr:uncharacterized protein B4U79_02748 [Dinothrombium tinctorium]